MPGRNDFGILRSRAITDPRVLRAAELYVEQKIAREETAHAAVLGHLACLGLWASKETDDGTLPGDGIAATIAATLTSPKVARVIVSVLSAGDVDLLTGVAGSLRLRGFEEAYRPLIVKRAGNAERAQRWRESNASRHALHNATSAGQPDQTRPDRTPLTPQGGEPRPSAPNGEPHREGGAPRPLRPRDRERLARILDYVVTCGTLPEQNAATELRRRYRETTMSDEEVAGALDRYKWVTKERLARHENPKARRGVQSA